MVFCIHINAQIINFPDSNFKNALVNTVCVDINGDDILDADADINNDGEIDVPEALKVLGLNVYNKQISTLDGIGNFANLIKLQCAYNQINSLNVQGLTKLVNLYCSENQLTSLNVQGLTYLTRLDCSNNQLTTLNVQGLSYLDRLDCSANQLTSLNLQGLINLNGLDCSENQITTLDVKELTILFELSCSENQITTLDLQGLTSLIFLSCSYNQLTSLNLEGLTGLVLIWCNNNDLTSINVSKLENLELLDCKENKLTNLDLTGLPLFELYCEGNQLGSILVKHCDNLFDIGISNNPHLSYICCDEDRIIFFTEQAIQNEITNCEINSYCTFSTGGRFYVIQGKNTYDYNNNGCDDLDIKLPNTKYITTNSIGNITGAFIANAPGNYQILLQEGTHTITPSLEHPSHFEVTPSSLTVTFPTTTDTITQNFCITPKGVFNKVNIAVLPLSPPARPGFDASYKIVWENVGNQIENGTLNFTYDETLLDYISATQTADQVADGIVKWNFTNLLPFEKREITVTLKVNRPTDTPAVNAGDKLYLTVSILDNIFTLENTVVGSYDPNDKTCLQGDRVKPDMVGEYVDYLIRFENTGNYAAENVVVKDIIDTKRFDVSTLQITDASHEVYTRIEGNKVEFIFENIQLPFDDANNDGYIAFKIKTLPTLVLGDSLKNKADIYFDYNFPIRTNEAKTTIALSVPTVDIITDFSIYPNPVRDILNISTEEKWTKAEIYDISGRIMRIVSLDSQSIDVSSLERGTYFIRLRNGNKICRVKFVKI